MIATALVVGWAVSTVGPATMAFVRGRARPRSPSAAPAQGAVLLLRPCAGAEPQLAASLASTARLPGDVRVRFLVSDASDGAYLAAIAAAAALRASGRDARVVETGARGAHPKVSQLAHALEVEDVAWDLLAIADSDVVLDAPTFASLLAALDGASAAWAPPVEDRPATSADRASAAILGASLHSFPMLARIDRQGLVGKLSAIRRDALDAIGGMRALGRHLGEDMEMARRLSAVGRTFAASATPAHSAAAGRRYRDVVVRYARWITVVRNQRPHLLASYPLLFCAAPLQLLAALVAGFVDGRAAVLALVAVLGARAVTAVLASRRAGLSVPSAVAIAAGDLLLLAAFVRAVTSRKVAWRGNPLAMGSAGLLLPGEDP